MEMQQTYDVPEQFLELLRQVGPADLLPAEAADQLLRSRQFGGAQRNLVFQALLLSSHLRELVIQSLISQNKFVSYF
jgi:hypothetical protein